MMHTNAQGLPSVATGNGYMGQNCSQQAGHHHKEPLLKECGWHWEALYWLRNCPQIKMQNQGQQDLEKGMAFLNNAWWGYESRKTQDLVTFHSGKSRIKS